MAAFDYTSRDFDTIKSDLLARASRVLPEWTDRDPSDFGMLLVDLWAHAADVMHYYIDRAAGEQFLSTAQQRESVLAFANLFDYTPRGRSAAEGSLTLQNTSSSAYTVPPLTQFVARYDETTYQVYTVDGGVIPATNSGVISVQEGELYIDEVLTTSAAGTNGQRYPLLNDNVVASSVRINVYEDGVNPIEYQRVQRITSAATGERVFVVSVSADGVTEIVFGSSLNGFVPPSGAKITATYADSSGATGNLPANSVIGWRNAAPSDISIVSSSSFTGGLNEESIASLRASIPSVLSAQNRAVTRNDFIRLAQQVEGVAKATVEYVPHSGGPSAGNASVTVYAQADRSSDYLTTGDTTQTVSATTRSAVVAGLQPRALLGVTVTAAPTITWRPIRVDVTVHVNERAVSNWVKDAVTAALDELFAFDNVFFGQRLTLSQLYRLLVNVDGVDYVEVTAFNSTDSPSVISSSILIDPLELPKSGTRNVTMVGGISTS